MSEKVGIWKSIYIKINNFNRVLENLTVIYTRIKTLTDLLQNVMMVVTSSLYGFFGDSSYSIPVCE